MGVFEGDLADVIALFEDLGNLVGDFFEGFDVFDAVFEAHIAGAAEVEGEHGADEELGGEGFSGGDADFVACALVDAAFGFAGDGGADDIGDGEGSVAFADGFAQGGESVDGFAGLADDEDEGVFIERGVTVAEF